MGMTRVKKAGLIGGTDSVSWSTRTYSKAIGGQMGKNLQAEERFKRQFPPLKRSISNPALIEDKDGIALAYYLPDVLLPARQVTDKL